MKCVDQRTFAVGQAMPLLVLGLEVARLKDDTEEEVDGVPG